MFGTYCECYLKPRDHWPNGAISTLDWAAKRAQIKQRALPVFIYLHHLWAQNTFRSCCVICIGALIVFGLLLHWHEASLRYSCPFPLALEAVRPACLQSAASQRGNRCFFLASGGYPTHERQTYLLHPLRRHCRYIDDLLQPWLFLLHLLPNPKSSVLVVPRDFSLCYPTHPSEYPRVVSDVVIGYEKYSSGCSESTSTFLMGL